MATDGLEGHAFVRDGFNLIVCCGVLLGAQPVMRPQESKNTREAPSHLPGITWPTQRWDSSAWQRCLFQMVPEPFLREERALRTVLFDELISEPRSYSLQPTPQSASRHGSREFRRLWIASFEILSMLRCSF